MLQSRSAFDETLSVCHSGFHCELCDTHAGRVEGNADHADDGWPDCSKANWPEEDIRIAAQSAFFCVPRRAKEIGAVLFGTFDNEKVTISGH